MVALQADAFMSGYHSHSIAFDPEVFRVPFGGIADF